MSTNIVYNGVTYTIPATDDVDWGEAVSNFLIAIPSGMLTKVGGAWALTDSDLDFGSAYGVVAKYFKSKSATLAQAGALRLALADKVAWRSDGNDKDLVLGPNSTDGLVWDGVELATISGTQELTNKTIDADENTIKNIRDADIAADALIAWSKIAFSGDFGSTSVITTGGVKLGSSFHVTLQADPSEDYDFVFPATDGTAGQALVKATGGELEWATIPGLALDAANLIVGSPTNLPFNVDTSAVGDILAGSVAGLTVKNDVLTNAKVKSDAAIALSKLATLTASRAAVTDGSGFISVSTVTATELGWVSGVTSGIQGQFNSITANVLKLQNIVSDTKEPMGLVVLPTPPAVTYEGSRQIKIAHPFSYYFKGTKVDSIADVTVTVPNTTGKYYIVFTNSGLTASAETTVDLLNQVIWSSFYWNATTSDYMFFEERHGISWTANEHSQAHLTRGAAYESGGAASGYVIGSDALADVQIALDATNFWDEDIRNALAAKLEASNWDKWYRSGGSGDWRKDTADTIPAFWAGTPPNGVAQINTTSGSWGLTPVTNGNYFNTYIFATNSKESANRFIIIAGQGQASTLSGAQALSVSNLALGTLPVQELLPLYKVTLRYRTVNTNNNARVTVEAVEDIRRTTSPGVSAGVSGTHNSLSGRSDADSHPTSAITGLNGEAASDTVRITVPQGTKSRLDSLTRKEGTLVYATDLDTLFADNGSALVPVGSSSSTGEKNYITNASMALATTGWNVVGDLNLTRSTTAAELPREFTTATGIKITADADTQSVADYVYYDFNLDDVDLSKKLKIQWAQKLFGAYTAGLFAVVITSQADRTTALHTPVTTAIPGADGVFTTSFDASTTAALSLVIRPALGDMTTDVGLVISDVVVGPGSIVTGAVIQDNITISSTVSGFGTGSASTSTLTFSRIGSNLYIKGYLSFTGAGTGSSEILLTLAGLSCSTTDGVVVLSKGDGTFTEAISSISGTSLRFRQADNTSLIGSETGTAANVVAYISFENVVVSIAEWAGSGTVNIAGNDVEYASVGGTWDDNSTTTVYGQGGVLMGGALSALRNKTITWQTPIQASDKIELEFSADGVAWLSGSSARIGAGLPVISSIDSGGTQISGFTLRHTSNTTTVVSFARYVYAANDDAPFDNWPNDYYWRVRKVSASSVAGFEMANATSAGLVSTQAQTFAGNKTLTGFTQLGDLAIKVKRLTGTTASTENASVTVAYGLTGDKIVGFTCKVAHASNRGTPPGYTAVAEYEYHVNHDSTNFTISNSATNSGSITSCAFSIVVFYIE